MNKLCRENVGRSFEIYTENLKIEYVIIDESFDHAFGTQRQYGFEIMSIKYNVAEIGEYLELENNEKINKYADKLIEKDL